MRPFEVTGEATVSNFRFNSSYDADVFTVAGVVGIPAKAARPFGKVGANYHRAIFATTQTQTDATENATQNYHVKTDGWGFVFGGGVEVWISRRSGSMARRATARSRESRWTTKRARPTSG
jgi:hypothetical protein